MIIKRYLCSLFLFLSVSFALWSQPPFVSDHLGPRFEQYTLHLPNDYEGPVDATLVRYKPERPSKKAILYLHGFNDYFFQKEMAKTFDAHNIHFYALDMRKYGRSLLPHQYPFNTRNLNEYFAEIDSSLYYINQGNYEDIILMGHSTGGLIAATYAYAREATHPVDALILNSPFLDMHQSWLHENVLIPIVAWIGKYFPNIKIPQSESTVYAESLLKQHHGEWEYNTEWKKMISPPLTSGWISAIYYAQKAIRNKLNLDIPILVLHSDKSGEGEQWSDLFLQADIVLDVNDIKKYTPYLGERAKAVTIEGGVHDLILSEEKARTNTYDEIFRFINEVFPK